MAPNAAAARVVNNASRRCISRLRRRSMRIIRGFPRCACVPDHRGDSAMLPANSATPSRSRQSLAAFRSLENAGSEHMHPGTEPKPSHRRQHECLDQRCPAFVSIGSCRFRLNPTNRGVADCMRRQPNRQEFAFRRKRRRQFTTLSSRCLLPRGPVTQVTLMPEPRRVQ